MATRGCDASGAATVAAGQRVGTTEKRAPANPSLGWIRAPGCRSEAIRESDRRPNVGADGREEGLPPDEKAVYAFYPSSRVKLIITMRFEGTKNLVPE
jgi:hypothetical protein